MSSPLDEVNAAPGGNLQENVDRLIKIDVTIRASQPELLTGLDVWLRLGLLSEAQVMQICSSLACPLPQAAIATAQPVAQVHSSQELPNLNRDFVTDSALSQSRQPRVRVGILQSLITELSVRWLLFLGVFMVVVSSGVLAASQWQKFPASGQYGVLLGYTLIFYGVSFWANKQPNLQLTTQTLQIVTLLLVPVNFWAMDSFGLWHHPLDWPTVVMAAFVLTAITVLLLKNRLPASSGRLTQLEWLSILNILELSYLHWGWRLPEFPLIAVYTGTVGTCLIAFYQARYRQQQLVQTQNQSASPLLSFGAAVVFYAMVVLLVRAIAIHLDVRQLGLAIGICGWIVVWLSSAPLLTSQVLWERIGIGLLLLGWLVAVGTKFPWQATAVSGLGLWVCAQRLRRFWRRAELAALLGIGLQTILLVWRLMPSPVQAWAIATGTQLTGAQDAHWALLSLALFPYLVAIVWLTDWLHRLSKPTLANFGEQLALGFGAVLTLLSLVNPTLRSLNLLLSTVTLGVVTQRRSPNRVSLVYLTHIMGILTLSSTIDRLYPNLSREVWAGILLVFMVAEWGFSLGNGLGWWRRSAWHIGLGLAALSYTLLWGKTSLLWLVTPLALTGIASQTAPPRRLVSSWLSVAALGISQLLTLTLPGIRLIGLGVATGLMLLNTQYLRQQPVAIITVGLGLTFTGMLLWDGMPGIPRISASGWYLAGAIVILCLWLLRGRLIRRPGTLAAIYAQANDGWAIVLCSLELILLVFHSLSVYWALLSPSLVVLVATALLMGAVTYRSWQQPSNWAVYGLGWGLELLIVQALGFVSHSVVNLAIANVALGILTLLLGEAWQWRHREVTVPSSWHILPLLYGGLSVVLRSCTFTSWTGLCSLGVALIAIGVGRRQQKFKPLVYLGILGISVSACELLLYQLQKLSGASFSAQLIAVSAVGISIAYVYLVLSPWLTDYLRLTASELRGFAHFHWAVSSICLLLAAIGSSHESSNLEGLGTGIFLIPYAIFQGRHHPNSKIAEIWVYLGLFEVVGIKNYWLNTPLGHLFSGPLFPWLAPITCVGAYFLYILPWQRWGFSPRPWQQAAIILPLIMIWETRQVIHQVSLLITASFYILIAQLNKQIRFTYISVVLVDWALWRWFSDLHLTNALWYVTLIGLSLLYVAQFDPSLKLPQQKQVRHSLRLLGAGTICGVALLLHQDTGLLPGILSLISLFAGLALRVRAFLFVGTAIFLLNAFYQLVVLILHHPFYKWVIGLLVGISFIWIAANFEARRAQLTSLVRNWITQLQAWE